MFHFRMKDLHKLTSRAHFPNEDLLRQAASRQSQTLYISSRVPTSVYVFRVDRFNSNGSFDAQAPQRSLAPAVE